MSNVIKPIGYITLAEKKMIENMRLPVFKPKTSHDEHTLSGVPLDDEEKLRQADEIITSKKQIMDDAEAYAEEHIRQTAREAEQMKEQARLEIEQWWEARRTEDEQKIEEAKQIGYDSGFQEGLARGEAESREQYQQMISEGKDILERALVLKRQIIQEAEPFLIDLSAEIAEKIMAHQLTVSPEWVISIVKNALSRRREQGVITLCVSPAQFTYIQDAREELLTTIDSQAELQIIPDSTVTDQGCVIRSSFGSIDARFKTQLDEIKSYLQQIINRNEGSEEGD